MILCTCVRPSDFPTKIVYAHLITTRTTYPNHLIILDLNTLVTFWVEYKL